MSGVLAGGVAAHIRWGPTWTRPPARTTAPCLPASTRPLRKRRPHTGLYSGTLVTHVEGSHARPRRSQHVLHTPSFPPRAGGGSWRGEVSGGPGRLPGCPWRRHMGEERVAAEALRSSSHLSSVRGRVGRVPGIDRDVRREGGGVRSCTFKNGFGLFSNLGCGSPGLPRRHGNRALRCHLP